MCAGRLVPVVPTSIDPDAGLVIQVSSVVQLVVHICVEGGDIGGADGGALRIVIADFAERVESRAGEAGVERPGGQLLINQQFLLEGAVFDAQIGFQQI